MPLSNLEAGAQPLAMFQLPTKGVWKNVSAHLIAPDALADVQNMFLFKGKLRPRPGMSDVTSSYGSVSANVILGGAFFIGGARSPRLTPASPPQIPQMLRLSFPLPHPPPRHLSRER